MSPKNTEGQLLISEESTKWNLSTVDAFGEYPICSKILCIMVGNGVQIAGIAIGLIISSAVGSMSVFSSKAHLITGIIAAYLLSAIIAGYVGVWLWRCIKGNVEGWYSVSWHNSCAFSSTGFAIFTVFTIIQYFNEGKAEIALSSYFALLALWIFVSIPLIQLGGLIASRASEPNDQFLAIIGQNNREAPTGELRSWILVLIAGLLPFGAVSLELYFVIINIAFGTLHKAFIFVVILSLSVVISCAMVSVGLTYRCIVYKTSMWGFQAFFASASSSLYVFILSVKYLIVDLRGLNGVVSIVVYLGYLMIFCVAIMLFTGTIGFLSAIGFLQILSFLESLGYSVPVRNKICECEMLLRSAGTEV